MTVSIWSSGGGVQSAAIAALIVQGELRPDLAVIVDTEREQRTTWEYMDAVIVPALTSVGVTLHRVKRSDYEWRDLYGGKDGKTLLLPAFTTQGAEIGKLPGWCSAYWKREVVKRWARERGAVEVENWLGISVDEKGRMSNGRGKWRNRFPLIERRMSRGDCQALVSRMGWPEAPRSSCWHCPNHTQEEWRAIRARPDEWAEVVKLDRRIRERDPHAFLHADAVPIEHADFAEANGVLFGHSCSSGHCFT